MPAILPFVLAASLAPQEPAFPAPAVEASAVVDYVEDGGTKVVAEVEVRALRKGVESLVEVAIRATGRRVEADPGITGVHGSNRHTGAEMQDMLRAGELELRWRARGGEWRNGELMSVRWQSMARRRLWDHRALGERAETERRYPVAVTFGVEGLMAGDYEFALVARAAPRFVAAVRVGPVGSEVLGASVCDRFGVAVGDGSTLRPVAVASRADIRRSGGRRRDPVQDPEAKPSPLVLPADWEQRDIEGRWVWFRDDMQRRAGDSHRLGQWAELLAGRKEFELLEMIGIYHGWAKVGPALAKVDAPQWIRVAIWNLHSYQSHNKENARDLLTKNAGDVLAWFERYPLAQRGPGQDLYEELLPKHQASALAPDSLPPLDGRELLMPYLDPPGTLVRFGDRLTAEPGTVYLHQVIRALEGVSVRGRLDSMGVTKVLRLTEHRMLPVRLQAFESLASLPPELVPWRDMERLASDPERDTVGRAGAVQVLGKSLHPEAGRALAQIATNPAHPCWRQALEIVTLQGGPVELAQLEGLTEHAAELADADQVALRAAIESLRHGLSSSEFSGNGVRRTRVVQAAIWHRSRGEVGAAHFRTVHEFLVTELGVDGAIGLLDGVATDDDSWQASGIRAADVTELRRELNGWVRLLGATGR